MAFSSQLDAVEAFSGCDAFLPLMLTEGVVSELWWFLQHLESLKINAFCLFTEDDLQNIGRSSRKTSKVGIFPYSVAFSQIEGGSW